MTTTLVAVFQGQDKADEALAALRTQYPGENMSVLVHSEHQSTARTTQSMNRLSREAVNITSSAGDLMVRTLAFTANAMLTLPFRMMAPMVHSLTGYADGTTGSNMYGSRTGAMSGCMNGNMADSTENSGGSQKVEVTLQGNSNLLEAVDILQNHGATCIQTYTA